MCKNYSIAHLLLMKWQRCPCVKYVYENLCYNKISLIPNGNGTTYNILRQLPSKSLYITSSQNLFLTLNKLRTYKEDLFFTSILDTNWCTNFFNPSNVITKNSTFKVDKWDNRNSNYESYVYNAMFQPTELNSRNNWCTNSIEWKMKICHILNIITII
jgi:hypothetical protein